MIDKKARREELLEAVRTSQETITKCRDNINYLHGAITLLNELIDDEEKSATEPAPELPNA